MEIELEDLFSPEGIKVIKESKIANEIMKAIERNRDTEIGEGLAIAYGIIVSHWKELKK